MEKKKVRVLEQKIQVSYVRRVPLVEKTCPVCGQKFEGVKIRKFCSQACRNKADYARNADTYRKARRERYRAQREA